VVNDPDLTLNEKSHLGVLGIRRLRRRSCASAKEGPKGPCPLRRHHGGVAVAR
jgi:hypothetical protein